MGILALAGAFHFGASTVQSQGAGSVVAVTIGNGVESHPSLYAFADCGDVYRRQSGSLTWEYQGNVFNAGPSKLDETTWSRLKSEFK